MCAAGCAMCVYKYESFRSVLLCERDVDTFAQSVPKLRVGSAVTL